MGPGSAVNSSVPDRCASVSSQCSMDRSQGTRRPTIVIAEYDRPEEVVGPLRADYCTVVVDSADAAFQICAACQVDLVITRAVFLRGMNAVELLDRLATLPSPPRVCLVTPFRLAVLNSLSGFLPPGVPILEKPIPPNLLVTTAGVLLKHN